MVDLSCCDSSRSSRRSGESEAGQKSVYKAVERHTSPSWYWAWDSHFLSWLLKLSLWNSLVMADRDFPLVSGRNRPTYRADNRQTAPKGTKQNSLNSLCKRKHNIKLLDGCKTENEMSICLKQLQASLCFSYACMCKHMQDSKRIYVMRN